jgi:NADH dehydrogenase FAD-containing subunit
MADLSRSEQTQTLERMEDMTKAGKLRVAIIGAGAPGIVEATKLRRAPFGLNRWQEERSRR